MSLSNNISGYKIQTVNLTAGQYSQVTGPGRAFEILQSGEDGTRTVIQALREADGYYSDNTGVQAFDASPGLNVVNFDKITLLSTVDSQMKIKIFTSKNVATVDTGPALVGQKTLWSTNVTALNLAQASLDPYELTGPDSLAGGGYVSRGDGIRELRYSDKAAINNDNDYSHPSNTFGMIRNTVSAKWTGYIANDTDFYMTVYGASYNKPGAALVWTLVQSFNAVQVAAAGALPTDAPETFESGKFVVTFDGQDTKDYSIPYGSIRVFLTAWTGTSAFRGILGATSYK